MRSIETMGFARERLTRKAMNRARATRTDADRDRDDEAPRGFRRELLVDGRFFSAITSLDMNRRIGEAGRERREVLEPLVDSLEKSYFFLAYSSV